MDVRFTCRGNFCCVFGMPSFIHHINLNIIRIQIFHQQTITINIIFALAENLHSSLSFILQITTKIPLYVMCNIFSKWNKKSVENISRK
eukprot:UN03329